MSGSTLAQNYPAVPIAGHTQLSNSQEMVATGQYQSNPYFKWFGPPTKIPQQGPNKDIHRTHKQGPAAWENKNVHVRDQILGLALTQPSVMSQIFPKRYTNEEHFTWSISRYDLSPHARVPNEGVVKAQQFQSETSSAGVQRVGGGIKGEWDFLQTPEGQQVYVNQVMQQSLTMVMTMELDAMNALRTKPLEKDNWERKYGYAALSVPALLSKMCAIYAMLHKAENGLGMYDVARRLEDFASIDGVTITDLLAPHNMRRHLDVAFKQTIRYSDRGPGGREQVANASSPKGQWGNWKLHEIKDHYNLRKKLSLNPMETFTMIGRYNTFFAKERPKDVVSAEDHINAATVQVYDQERDSMVDITAQMLHMNLAWERFYFKEYNTTVNGLSSDDRRKIKLALLFFDKKCHDPVSKAQLDPAAILQVYNQNIGNALPGDPDFFKKAMSVFKVDGPDTEANWKEKVKNIRAMADYDDDDENQVQLQQKKEIFAAVVRNMSYMTVAPFMRQLMAGVCALRGGKDTGEMVVGGVDYGMSVNNNDKTFLGNLTYKTACIIYVPQNIFWLDNIQYKQYLGGSNTQFFTHDELRALRDAQFRFNFLPLSSSLLKKSLIVVPMPKTCVTQELQSCIDITGKFLDERAFNEPVHFKGADFINEVLQTHNMRNRKPVRVTFQKQLQDSNTICYQSKQIMQSRLGVFDKKIDNTGPHGKREGPGARAVRDGDEAEVTDIKD